DIDSGVLDGLRVDLRIFPRDLVAQALPIEVADAFSDMESIASRMLGSIEIRLSIKANRVDDERIAFPLSYGMSEPVRVEFFGMTASVREHDVENVVRFEKEREALG